ncbi:MAG: glycosyltransferase family 4 protein [Hyphomicrobiaceae bacterium]
MSSHMADITPAPQSSGVRTGEHDGGAPTRGREGPHILFLAQLPPPVHGVTVVSGKVFDKLRSLPGAQVEHIWLGSADRLEDIGRRTPGKLVAFAKLLAGLLRRRLAGRRADIAYLTLAPWTHAAMRDALVAAAAKGAARRVLVHLHGEGLDRLLAGASPADRLKRRLLRGVELVVITEKAKRLAEASGLFGAVHEMANATTDPGPVQRGAASRPVCGFLGNLDRRKGVLRFIDMLSVLHAGGATLTGRVAGGDTPDLTSDRLRSDAAKRGLAGSVEVLGPLYGPDKDRFLAGLDIFVYLSRHDHAPLVLIEAMSHGAVPIVLDTGGIAQILGPALAANVLPDSLDDRSAAAAAAALVARYAANPSLLHHDRERARARYLAAYGEDVFRTRVAAIVAGAGSDADPRSC